MSTSGTKFLVDPATVVAAAEALGQLYKKFQDERQRRQIVSLLKQINGKLDLIIQNQDIILNELRALRVQFRADLRDEIVSRMQGSLNSYRSQLNIRVASIDVQPRKASLAEISALADPVEKLGFDLLHYGPAAFTGAMGSALLLHSIFLLQRDLGGSVIKINTREAAYLGEWEKVFSLWYSPSNLYGIAHAATALTSNRQQLEELVYNYPKRVSYGWYFTGQHHDVDNYRYEVWQLRDLIISGDLASGFSDYLEIVETSMRNAVWLRGSDGQGGGGGGGGPRNTLTEEEFWTSLPPEKKWMLAYDAEEPFDLPGQCTSLSLSVADSMYSKANVTAFGDNANKFFPVNAPETQFLQAKRLEWLELVPKETQMRELAAIVSETREMFRSRVKELGG